MSDRETLKRDAEEERWEERRSRRSLTRYVHEFSCCCANCLGENDGPDEDEEKAEEEE